MQPPTEHTAMTITLSLSRSIIVASYLVSCRACVWLTYPPTSQTMTVQSSDPLAKKVRR